MEKINILELLKDCPAGMELDCLLYDGVIFKEIEDDIEYPISIRTKEGETWNLTSTGCWDDSPSAKCVIFPKGKTTWEGFVPPCKFKVGDWITDGVSKCQIYFIDDTQYWYSENCILGSIESVDKQYHLWTINDAKDGDVLFHSDSASNGIFIFKEILQLGTLQKVICYCDYDSEDGFCLGENHTCCWADSKILRPATEERRNRLFQKMREAGYRWNPETKVLEKVVVPEFKIGDKITNGKTSITIGYIDDEYYYEIGRNITTRLLIKNQDEWNLIPKRFDLNTLKPLQPVLVRNTNGQVWTMDFFSHKIDTNKGLQPSIVCVGHCPNQCIPYKGNEFLRGTSDECKDFYKTWE